MNVAVCSKSLRRGNDNSGYCTFCVCKRNRMSALLSQYHRNNTRAVCQAIPHTKGLTASAFTQIPISEISAICGFRGLSYFAKNSRRKKRWGTIFLSPEQNENRHWRIELLNTDPLSLVIFIITRLNYPNTHFVIADKIMGGRMPTEESKEIHPIGWIS